MLKLKDANSITSYNNTLYSLQLLLFALRLCYSIVRLYVCAIEETFKFLPSHRLLLSLDHYLTEAGAYSQLPTQQKIFWLFSNLYSNLIWSFWVASRRKIEIWIRGKRFTLLLKREVGGYFWQENATFSNKLNFFSSSSNFDFFSQGNSKWPY